MKLTQLFATTGALALFTAASAEAGLVDYQFPGGVVTPTSTVPNVTAGNINSLGAAGGIEAGVSIADSIFYRLATGATTAAQAVTNNEYFQFTLTPNAGYDLDLTSVSFSAARGGSSAPRGFLLRTSLDGFASDVATGTVSTVDPNLSAYNIDLSGPAFQNINTAMTFRLFQFSTGGSNTGIFYDNISVNGAVTASVVPEPGTALFGLALIGVTTIRRRR